MILEKTKISKDFPVKIKFYFQKKNWYLFPQGFTSKGTMSRITYNSEKSKLAKNDVQDFETFWVIYNYCFKWLFLTIIFESRFDSASNGKTSYFYYQYRDIDNSKEVNFKTKHNG